jgi:hypothetical protein
MKIDSFEVPPLYLVALSGQITLIGQLFLARSTDVLPSASEVEFHTHF